MTQKRNPKDIVGASKVALSCVPANVIMEVAVALQEGARKYGRHNYREIPVSMEEYYNAAQRHLMRWWEGGDIDKASGLNEITKAIAGLCVLRDAMMRGMAMDDRPPKSPEFIEPMNEAVKLLIKKYPKSKPPVTEKKQ